MKIAVDLRSLMGADGKISGVENYLLNILKNLQGQEYVGLYNGYAEVNLPEFPGMEIRRSKIPNKFFNTSLSFLNYPKFENLYGEFEWLWLPDIRPFAIQRKTKLAITVHDLSAFMRPEFYSLKRKIWHWLINYKKALERADIIFAVSEYTKKDLMRRFGINENKIKVVYPGIDHKRFRNNFSDSEKTEIQNKYSLPQKYILSISTIEPRKNIEAIISAFESVPDPNLNLVIAGRLGWLYGKLLTRAEKSPKRAKIRFLGYVSEEDKPKLIASSTVVCYPSFYEGFGFIPLEAMACGVPVITSTRTSTPEVAQDAAILIEPYNINELRNAIVSLDTDPKLKSMLISKGLERVKLFDWAKTAEEIKNYLK